MSTNVEFATQFINTTNASVFLTGKAGTGKTTFLKEIYNSTFKQTVIGAPTGIAAINAGGSTLHSLFQLPFGGFVPVEENFSTYSINSKIHTPSSLLSSLKMNEVRRSVLRNMELLIIDEVSMLRADLLDAIDTILRHVRREKIKPFGGVQVLFIGDLLQLPPVVQDSEWSILSKHYRTPFFFDAHVLRSNPPVFIELEKVYRQGDDVFINVLNNLRNNSVTRQDIDLLNRYYRPDFKPDSEDNFIQLTTHNFQADDLNKKEMEKLNTPSHFFEAETEGIFSENSYPIDHKLELKTGAQVMFIKNDVTGAQRYFNGKIGKIEHIKGNTITIGFNDGSKSVSVDRYQWENKRYSVNEISGEIEEEIIGTFSQFPIKPAWAITIHKSQGLTFDKAVIDTSKAFAPGQVYVALSRLRSLDGLVLTSPINYNSLSIDHHIRVFNTTKPDHDQLTQHLEVASKAFLHSFTVACFDLSLLAYQFDKHRNSYDTSKKKSVKMKYVTWITELLDRFKEQKEIADRFIVQLDRIFSRKQNLPYLHERIQSANEHFETELQGIRKTITLHTEHLAQNEKGVKTYIQQLNELEGQITFKLERMQKAVQVVNSGNTGK